LRLSAHDRCLHYNLFWARHEPAAEFRHGILLLFTLAHFFLHAISGRPEAVDLA
jgi:hypothetical protein